MTRHPTGEEMLWYHIGMLNSTVQYLRKMNLPVDSVVTIFGLAVAKLADKYGFDPAQVTDWLKFSKSDEMQEFMNTALEFYSDKTIEQLRAEVGSTKFQQYH